MSIAGLLLILFLVSIFILSLIRYKKRVETEQRERALMAKKFEQELLQSRLETQEETFRHIAKELHDNVGQLLSTTKMLMGVTELKFGNAPDTLHTASATLGKAIQEIRLLSRSLDKEWLEQFSFLENLQSEVNRINSSESVCASIRGEFCTGMKPEEQIILFRIVQEAIQNAIRHAKPSRLEVEVGSGPELIVRVINDGKPLPAQFYGMGTKNMQYRARLFGGRVDWESADNQTIVSICLPLTSTHEN